VVWSARRGVFSHSVGRSRLGWPSLAEAAVEVLRRLGWTQKEIGEAMGLDRSRISKLMCEIPESVKGTKTQLAKAHQIDEVAEAYNMPPFEHRAGPWAGHSTGGVEWEQRGSGEERGKGWQK